MLDHSRLHTNHSHETRDYEARAFTIAIGGAPKSGRAALLLALCRLLRDSYSLAVATSETSPTQDGGKEFLLRHRALASERIAVVEAGVSPHQTFESLMEKFRPELLFIESVNDDLECSRAVADFTIYVIDAFSDRVPPNEWADVSMSDLLVVNKTCPGPPVDMSLNVVARESAQLRGDAARVFAQTRYGLGIIEIAKHFLASWRQATTPALWTVPPVPAVTQPRALLVQA